MNSKTRQLVFFLIFAFFQIGYGQLESAHWYFGTNAGLDFTSGSPVEDLNGQLRTTEGCASISDRNGNLLFYTDGEDDTYNRNHTPFPNGGDLLGNNSSSQSAIIIPHPGNEDLFYIITVDADDNNPQNIQGLNYSLVDMTLDNGLGDIVLSEKNINLLPITSEKITAVSHANGSDFWLITHFRNSFYAFLFDENGINTNPVISTVGTLVEYSYIDTNRANQRVYLYPLNSRGYIKASPSGEYVAIAHLSNLSEYPAPADIQFDPIINPNNAYAYASSGVLALYDFNNNTGRISNETILDDRASYYGIEFSPNSQFLYANQDFFSNAPLNGLYNELSNLLTDASIVQYNLTSNNIPLSVIEIDNNSPIIGLSRGALQLALDGKIYYTLLSTNFLSVINNPNELGLASDFGFAQFPLSRTTFYGLPPFITSFFLLDIIIEGTLVSGDGCTGSVLSFSVNTNADVDTVEWNFGDGSPILVTNNADPVEYQYNSTGVFTVTVTVTDVSGDQVTDSSDIEIFESPLVQDTSLEVCEDTTSTGIGTFDLTLVQDVIVSDPSVHTITYHNSLDDANENVDVIGNFTNFQNSNPNTETVYARVENAFGCHSVAEILLTIHNKPVVNNIPITECETNPSTGIVVLNLTNWQNSISTDSNITFTYYESEANALDEEMPIEDPTNYENTTPSMQTIFVRVENENCFNLAELDLTVNEIAEVTNTSISLCEFDGNGMETFDLTSVATITVSNSEDYNITYHTTETGAEILDDIINTPETYENELPNNQIIYVRVEGTNECFNIAEIELFVSDAERFQVEPITLCDVDNDSQEVFNLTEIEATILALDHFNLDDDDYSFTYYLTEEDAVLSENEIPESEIINYTNQSESQTIFVRVNIDLLCDAIVEFQLELVETPVLNLSPHVICPVESLGNTNVVLDAGPGFSSYQWSGLQEPDTNQALNLQTLTVTQPGIYTILVTNNNEDSNNQMCSSETNITVTESTIPVITQLLFSGNNSQNVQIIAEDENPPLNYSLDLDPLSWRINNEFLNLISGNYTAYVRNADGCINSTEFDVFSVPNLITPNKDGYNDYWIIPGLENYNNVHIRIFDRYGKNLVDMIYNPANNVNSNPDIPVASSPITGGSNLMNTRQGSDNKIWDGYYLGRTTPSTSYWYIIDLEDGRRYTGWLGVKNY